MPTVDIAAGTLIVTPPDGLFEELPEDEAEPVPDVAEGDPEGEPGPASTD